jgi:hypothetical protein
MSKFQPYSRRALRGLFWSWSTRNRRLLARMGVVVVIVLILMTVALTAWWTSAARWYVLGFIHAAFLGAFAHIVSTTFLAHNRDAIWLLRGAWGEDNTRSELQRAKRKRLIWGWVDSVNFQTGDIDHLVVTRRGGLVAIDSKWRTEPVTDQVEMARSAQKVKLRAEAVARTLLRGERGTHRAATNPLSVLPAIVLWGPSQHEVPDQAQSSGIDFIGGRRLLTWLEQIDGQPIDKDAAADLLRRLEEFRASAWDKTVSGRS